VAPSLDGHQSRDNEFIIEQCPLTPNERRASSVTGWTGSRNDVSEIYWGALDKLTVDPIRFTFLRRLLRLCKTFLEAFLKAALSLNLGD
jgi:hypothetical protein